MPSACMVDYGALAAGHPTSPIHKTSFLACQLPQMARRHPGLYARCGTYHIAPSDLSLGAPAAVEAVPVVEAQAGEELLLAGCLHDHPPAAARQPIYQSVYHLLFGTAQGACSCQQWHWHKCLVVLLEQSTVCEQCQALVNTIKQLTQTAGQQKDPDT